MKVALFGGTFNPPHIGHIEICEHLLAKGFDEVWIIVCFRHPFGKPMAPFWDRFKMVKKASGFLGKRVRVMDVERRLGGLSYSIRTVRYLKNKYPGYKFSWVVGGDNLDGKEKWKDEERFKDLVEVVKISRGKDSPIKDISSREIRDLIKNGGDFGRLVPPKIFPFLTRQKSKFLN